MPALLVALAGLLVGELLRRRLVTGGYRLDDDLGARFALTPDQPAPSEAATEGWILGANDPALLARGLAW